MMNKQKLFCCLLVFGVVICWIYVMIVSLLLDHLGGKRPATHDDSEKCAESNFYHYNANKDIYTLANKTTVLKQTPSLHWIEKLGQTTALQTIPAISSPNCSETVFLVMLVVSKPEHFEQRNAIRSSWGKLFHSKRGRNAYKLDMNSYKPNNLVKTVFLLGRSGKESMQAMVNYENDLYDDIVSGNFEDSYRNLVLKTRLGITWAYAQCSSAYLLKTDDDVFINIKPLVRWLWNSADVNNYYTGWCNYRSQVSRNKLSKWYVSVEDYPEDEFPPYCLGGGYLISSDIISKIIKTLYTTKTVHLEDVFVGMAINKLNIQPRDNKKLFNLLFAGINDLCDYLSFYLLHPVQTSELLSMHVQSELAQDSC